MKNKVVLITGASAGIGKAAAIELARKGATVVAALKASSKSEAALAEIRAKSGSQKVYPIYVDLSVQHSIRECASEFQENYERLDVLINNAGVYRSKRTLTPEGNETTLAVNVLAPYLLTTLLVPILKKSAPSRIVNVSSAAARRATIDFDNVQGQKRYNYLNAYSQSKLMLNLLSLEFARLLEGSGVTVNFLHPGVVRTDLARDLNQVARALFAFVQLFFASPKKGAETVVYLASSPEVEGVTGKYFGKMRETRAPEASYDRSSSEKVWKMCEELTGCSMMHSTAH